VGAVGSASALKLCVNQSLGLMAAGLGESLRLGRDLGLERELLLDVLSQTGYGSYLSTKRPMIEVDDYSGTTFSLDLIAMDLDLAVTSADSELEVTRACLDQAKRTLAAGHSGEDFAAITGHLAGEGEANGY
jgi:3-hydroxyisobutyrate dehydrogenase